MLATIDSQYDVANVDCIRIPVTVYPVILATSLEDEVAMAEVADKVAINAVAEFMRQVKRAVELQRRVRVAKEDGEKRRVN